MDRREVWRVVPLMAGRPSEGLQRGIPCATCRGHADIQMERDANPCE
nr:MAG TPA: E10-like protein [Caudoviricetes sp.]